MRQIIHPALLAAVIGGGLGDERQMDVQRELTYAVRGLNPGLP
jgi:hypothetical protein